MHLVFVERSFDLGAQDSSAAKRATCAYADKAVQQEKHMSSTSSALEKLLQEIKHV